MRVIHNESFYSSGTVVATGNTGVIAVPIEAPEESVRSGLTVVVPLYFTALGVGQATDETNDVKIDWYADSGGTYTHGTTTFAQMTAGDMIPPIEYWPGDVTVWGGADVYRPPWVPIPPYCKITHTLAGTTKSMSYTITMTYLVM